ncbi:MAG: hypothetical protein CMB80_32440 [Flammeovirgaceae bacterium]|nr:hypothetical protein [Flammeovirgaceae bacterium]MBE61458.1 hypothetical protein [Flammeovirgaceae bacterium]MBR10289.1 hypothetical protein [Rickettsiales bacterium]|tara:strand:- start:63 stop:431 length:369 start_codon:yes stop_codon:yes gene_type:complete
MMNLFYEGGPLFMGLVTIVFFSGIAVAIMAVISILKGADTSKVKATLEYVKSIGVFALIVGVLGQMIGMYSAFEAIAEMGEVSQALLAGGLRVSAITTIYGLISCVICYLIYFGLSVAISKK